MCSYCWGQYDPRAFNGRPLPNSAMPLGHEWTQQDHTEVSGE